ncbi:MAG: 30S ribosomal protein S14, partial [Pyrinomonadaceae bacterium]|nr:30S ribosomal protein S14 [Pyrinomonadaceae bacterium]
MAKISKIVKNEKRKKKVLQFAERRAAMKKIINNPLSTPEQVDEAVMKLQKLPRDASPVRVRNRCSQTGRSRGFLRKFGMSR